MPVQETLNRLASRERIDQLEAQVERLKGALAAAGVPRSTVEAIALNRFDNWATAVGDTTVDL